MVITTLQTIPTHALSSAIGLLLVLTEYPAPFMFSLGTLFSNLYVRGFLYLGLAVPNFFQPPTIPGGLYLACTAATYLAAASKGEEWVKEGRKR